MLATVNLLAFVILAAVLPTRCTRSPIPSWQSNFFSELLSRWDPCSKTESEVATLEYVRRNTTIPVAETIAWSSSADNEPGCEWCLLEKLEGVGLDTVWRKMPWNSKTKLVEDLTGFVSQLWFQRFEAIGSLYFSGARKRCKRIHKLLRPEEANPDRKGFYLTRDFRDEDFIVGTIVDSFLLRATSPLRIVICKMGRK